MICSISQWLISGAFDSHKEVPGFLRPHINRCAACRDFVQLTQTLEQQAANDAQVIIQKTPNLLQERIKSQPIQSIEQEKQTWMRPLKLIPTVSFSLAAILLAVFLVFQPFKDPSPSQRMDPFLMFGKTSLPEGTLQKLASQIESPYEAEWNSLKKNVKSAAERLSSQLDLKFVPNKQM